MCRTGELGTVTGWLEAKPSRKGRQQERRSSSDVSDADRLGNFLQGHDPWIARLAERCHVQGARALRSSPAPRAAGTTPAGKRTGTVRGTCFA